MHVTVKILIFYFCSLTHLRIWFYVINIAWEIIENKMQSN